MESKHNEVIEELEGELEIQEEKMEQLQNDFQRKFNE